MGGNSTRATGRAARQSHHGLRRNIAGHCRGGSRTAPTVPPVRRARLHAEAHRGTAVPCPDTIRTKRRVVHTNLRPGRQCRGDAVRRPDTAVHFGAASANPAAVRPAHRMGDPVGRPWGGVIPPGQPAALPGNSTTGSGSTRCRGGSRTAPTTHATGRPRCSLVQRTRLCARHPMGDPPGRPSRAAHANGLCPSLQPGIILAKWEQTP